MRVRTLVTAVLALLVCAPASADVVVLQAYGTGATTCTVQFSADPAMYAGDVDRARGDTICTAPVQQSCRVTWGAMSQGLSANCHSEGWTYFHWPPSRPVRADLLEIRYEVSLVAPLGQGWVAAPDECSGVGTDRLWCMFEDVSPAVGAYWAIS